MLDLHFALCLFTLPSFTLSALIMQSESVSKGGLRNVTANGFDGKGSKSFGQSEVQSTFEYPIYFLLICTQFHYNQLKHTHRHTHASTLLSLVYILAKCKSFCLSSGSFVAVNYILFTHKKTRRLAEAATKSFRLFTIQINVNMCICIYLYVCLCISRNTLAQQNENGDKSKQSENICYSGRADETDWESATQWERNVAHALKSFLQAPSFVYNSSRRCLCVCVCARERV